MIRFTELFCASGNFHLPEDVERGAVFSVAGRVAWFEQVSQCIAGSVCITKSLKESR
jgi:hypothetical protein